ncbi:hypothetical protein ABH930_003348 [Kitasatospora sp. GAS204A]|nr:hypothetical protein [Kitasatospora sp. GAS204B]
MARTVRPRAGPERPFRRLLTAGHLRPQVVADLRRAAEGDTAQTRVRAMATARLSTVLYRQGDRTEADHHAAQATSLAATVGSARLASALCDMRHAALR